MLNGVKVCYSNWVVPDMDNFSTNLPSVPEQSSNPDSDLANQNIDQRAILGITENGVTGKHQKEVKVQSIWHSFVSMVRVRFV